MKTKKILWKKINEEFIKVIALYVHTYFNIAKMDKNDVYSRVIYINLEAVVGRCFSK